jgi:8-amino-7-oxononanoate synthase
MQKYYENFLEQHAYPRDLKNYHCLSDVSSAHLVINGQRLINFSANDYLGLSQHPLVMQRSQEYARCWGAGATSSRLVTGNYSAYAAVENKLAAALGKETALILNSGYQANCSVLEALFDSKVLGCKPLVFSDRFCHVSMLVTTRYVAHLQRFRHNDLNHLQQLLEKYRTDARPKFILVESLYSMDGDQADLKNLIRLAKEYQAFLYVDDAHAVGVYGRAGFGLAAEHAAEIDLIMGTFSKAGGSFGAYVACSAVMRRYLVNQCKGLIYSTGLPPAVLGAIDAAIELFPQMGSVRYRLHEQAVKLRQFFMQHQLNCGDSQSHIVPWVVGDAQKALTLSQLLQEQGILGSAIRPPTVPVGQSRIRFCLSAAHSDADLEQLMRAISVVARHK